MPQQIKGTHHNNHSNDNDDDDINNSDDDIDAMMMMMMIPTMLMLSMCISNIRNPCCNWWIAMVYACHVAYNNMVCVVFTCC